MLEGSAGGFAVIFEDEHVAEALVVFQVEHAVAVGPQNILDGARRERGEGGHVVGRFDNDFVSADAVHFIEEAFAFAVEIAFNDERGEAIGNDANVPAGGVGAATIAAVNENFGRRFPRSVEMMTQRPVIGSLRNSGKASLLEFKSHDTDAPRQCSASDCTASGGAFYSWGLKASLWRRTAGEWPGWLSMARTSKRQGRFETWRSARKRCAVRATTRCLSVVMLSSGRAVRSSRKVRVRTSTKARVSPS